jgi:hypothetical protein
MPRRAAILVLLAGALASSCGDDVETGGPTTTLGGAGGTGGGQGGAAGEGGSGGGSPCDPSEPPEIESLSGADTLTHGASYQIDGRCLGLKNPVAPLSWDNAEERYPSVQDGALVPVDDDAQGGYPFRINLSDSMSFATAASQEARGVSTSHYAGFGATHKTNAFRGYDYNPEGVGHGHQEMYISWYVRTDLPSTSASTKLIRLWAGDHNGRTYRMSWTTSHLTFGYSENTGVAGDEWAFENHPLIDSQWDSWDGEDDLDNWHRVSVYFRASSSPTTTDGRIQCSTDGREEHDLDLATWLAAWDPPPDYLEQSPRAGDDPLNNIFLLGLDPSVDIGAYTVEVDDLYVDRTPARIELCDVAHWADRGGATCELQIPHTTWQDHRIELRANQGALPSGQQAYLYVMSPAGLVNDQGFPVPVSD